MNELVIPPAPLWYRSSVVTCAPDNTLVYGSKNDIIVLKEGGPEECAEVTFIQGAHSKTLTSISLNKKWKDPHSYAVSLGEDSVIKVWNLETFEKKTSNKDHVEHKEPVIGAVFAGDDRVVSAASNGFITIWNINTNESKPLKDLFKSKVTITCLSSCPHATWLLAFGLNNGGVVVADLRRNGRILYKLRGHYQAVVSLSWCPAPVNIFPRHIQNKVKNKSEDGENNNKNEDPGHAENKINNTSEGGEIENKNEDPKLENEPNVSQSKKSNPWINLVHVDDAEISQDEQKPLVESDDFLDECNALKSKILGEDVPTTPSKKLEETFEALVESIKELSPSQETCQQRVYDRPLPKLFDPSGDFLDDLVSDTSFVEDKNFKSGHEEECETKIEKKSEESEQDEDKNVDVERENNQGVIEQISETEDKNAEQEANAVDAVDSGIMTDESFVKNDETAEEPRTEYLLASSGKDKSIYIWRAGTDGRMQTFFNMPKRGSRRDKNSNAWIAICWVAPDTILSSSATGEVLAWPLPKPKESNKQYKVVHYEHSSLIFNIVAPPKYSSRYNWRDQIELKVWTWGQDGRLINYDVNEGKVRLSYSTVTASVTCLDTLSLDPNRLAIGLRDGNIRVWDLSLPHTKIVKMQKYQQKFTHKVSAIAWHPIKEMVLGFGTEEGRVGFIEMISKKNTLFPHYFRNQVYKVEWGPIEGNKNNLGLYVLAEGKMAVYDITQPNEDPIQLELPEKLYVYKFAWKPDFTLLLINGKDGLLLILTTDLVALTTLYPTEKCLNKIVWHPDAFTNNVEISPRCKWFAATTSKGLLVYDCSSIEENKNFADNIVANFEGHLKPPLSLAWCPFEGNKIVSTAADGLALVWDVITKSLISTFVDPFIGHNQSILWSPHDPDLIIIGDRTIRIWRISKNPPRTDEEFLTARKRLLAKTAKSDLEKSNKNKTKADVPSKIKIVAKNSIVPPFYVSNDENISAQVAEMRKVLASGESLVENVDNSLDPLQLFGTKQQVSQLLDANYDQQKKEGKHKSCEMISLWKGNLEDHIQDAINENRVTPTLIVLAPMVSPKLWRNACEVYAKKLSEEANSDPLETAMYFLACHKVEEAVNCLCLNSMFREALALTKQRFPEDSDMITKVTEQWAEHCTNTGNFENAAFCYISLKQYEDAAKVLARRSHKEFLEFAAELAEKAQNKKLYNSIKFKCTEIETAEQNATTENEENVPSRVDAVLKNITENDEQSVSGSESEDKSEKEVKEIEVSLSLKVTDQITQDDEVPKSSDYGEEQEIQNIC